MSKFKMGERWANAKWELVANVVSVSRGYAWCRDKDGYLTTRLCTDAVDWTKTHEADGSPVKANEPAEIRYEIDWKGFSGTYFDRGIGTAYSAREANGRSVFIAWEFEDGFRSRVSVTMYRANGCYESGDYRTNGHTKEPVRAVAVILEGGA